jgi:hypothetical protein
VAAQRIKIRVSQQQHFLGEEMLRQRFVLIRAGASKPGRFADSSHFADDSAAASRAAESGKARSCFLEASRSIPQ